ncbi:MAG: HAD-IA family hydrolase, partial [Elusimicrobia bacterium]|nr:HAD-IA family hydrolase [Elusimicrobiota bacterium]
MAPTPTRPYDLVAFDCYGTLIDWEAGMTAALEKLGRDLGVQVDAKQMVRRYIQLELSLEQASYRRYRDILRLGLVALFKERGIKLSAAASRAFATSLAEWKPFPETAATLKRLRAAGYRTAVLSNIDDALLARSLKRIGVPFDYRITAQAVRSYKPGVRHWEKLLAVSGVPKRRVLHVAASLVHDIIP